MQKKIVEQVKDKKSLYRVKNTIQRFRFSGHLICQESG